jgi:hypothetical protein
MNVLALNGSVHSNVSEVEPYMYVSSELSYRVFLRGSIEVLEGTHRLNLQRQTRK